MQVYGERRRALMAQDLSPQLVEYAERTVDDILEVMRLPTSTMLCCLVEEGSFTYHVATESKVGTTASMYAAEADVLPHVKLSFSSLSEDSCNAREYGWPPETCTQFQFCYHCCRHFHHQTLMQAIWRTNVWSTWPYYHSSCLSSLTH